jgi:toxin-antitoxin system PIN domain toxin
VILIDANLLIYAYSVRARQHEAARRWLEDRLSGNEAVALPWEVVHAFLRLTTGGVVLDRPTTIEQAFQIVNRWFALPHVVTLVPGGRYWEILQRVCTAGQVRGKVVSDAHLAALAIENDATMYTADADFRRFSGLRVINPLA